MTSPRPQLFEKTQYQPGLPQEEFIVPVLRGQIEQLLSLYAGQATLGRLALDVGCGGQPFRSHLEFLGYCYAGLDVQQNPAGTVDYLCEIDQPLPQELQQAQFNLILCTEVLEHVANWGQAFTNLAALLAPGGRLLITCPHFYQLHEEPYDFWRPTPHALAYFGQQAGLTILAQRQAGDTWDILGTLLGNCYAAPVTRRWRDRLLNKLTTWAIRGLYQWLKSRSLQAAVALHSPLYLSNVVMFEKPQP